MQFVYFMLQENIVPCTIALTGGVGSGKSSVARAFARLDITVVDADIISREIVTTEQPTLHKMVEHFGKRILNEDGTLHRRYLREIIFSQAEERIWLENLLHPLINARAKAYIARAHSPWCLWVVPLLVEKNLQHQADRVLVVDVDESVQLQRVMARDEINASQAKKLIAVQASREARLAIADDIIDNNGAPEAIFPQVVELNRRYLSMFGRPTELI